MLRHLFRDERGGNSVELVFVIPGLLLLTFGIIDFGRAVFDWNAVEKATQIAAREAITRDPVAVPIKYHFECDPPSDTTVVGLLCSDPDGGVRSECDFGIVECTASGCTRGGAALSSTKVDEATFDAIVARMRSAMPRLTPENVTLIYKPSKLGFIGKPDGPVPEVTARVTGMPFDFWGLALFNAAFDDTWNIPTLSTTLTGEDISNNSCAEQGLTEQTTATGQLVCEPGGNASSTSVCW